MAKRLDELMMDRWMDGWINEWMIEEGLMEIPTV